MLKKNIACLHTILKNIDANREIIKMNSILPFILFIVGFAIVVKGSDWFVEATVRIARAFKVPDVIIGATLVSLCTTLPELMVSSSSALKGNANIAFGNALGSIACNAGLILATIILLSQPEVLHRKSLKTKSLLCIALLVFVALNGMLFGFLTRQSGIILLLVLAWYLYRNIKKSLTYNSKKDFDDDDELDVDINEYAKNGNGLKGRKLLKTILEFAVGLFFTIVGSDIIVDNAQVISKLIGIPDIVIGLTLTAVGTSLPEFITAITAIRKNVHNVSIGNILGANILNIIWVMSVSSIILPIPLKQNLLYVNLPFVLAINILPLIYFSFSKKNIKRINGAILLSLYVIYVATTFLTSQ